VKEDIKDFQSDQTMRMTCPTGAWLLHVCSAQSRRRIPEQGDALQAQAGDLPRASRGPLGWLPMRYAAAALATPCAPLTVLTASSLLSAG